MNSPQVTIARCEGPIVYPVQPKVAAPSESTALKIVRGTGYALAKTVAATASVVAAISPIAIATGAVFMSVAGYRLYHSGNLDNWNNWSLTQDQINSKLSGLSEGGAIGTLITIGGALGTIAGRKIANIANDVADFCYPKQAKA